MELLLEQISQITHGVVLNRIKPKVQSEGIEYPILSISQLLDEENGITDYEVPSVFVDKKKVGNLNLAREHSIVIGLTSFHRAAVLEKLVELSGGQENKAEEFFRALKENADAV